MSEKERAWLKAQLESDSTPVPTPRSAVRVAAEEPDKVPPRALRRGSTRVESLQVATVAEADVVTGHDPEPTGDQTGNTQSQLLDSFWRFG